MNKIMSERYPLFEMYLALRGQLMEILTDEDLAFTPGGENLALGILCREIGETERCYIDSLINLTQDFSYRNNEPGLEKSVEKLSVWFNSLDQELKATIESY